MRILTGKIVTEFWAKPIPLRHFDWAAHYDDPEGPVGWGATEQEAIIELTENYERISVSQNQRE